MTPPDPPAPTCFADPSTAREVFLAWERRRLVYNAVRVVVVRVALAPGGPVELNDPAFRRHLLVGAVAANVRYGVGPGAEGYLAFLGASRRAARGVLFGFALLLASGLAFLDVLFWSLCRMN